ncbi:MAG: MMPL family transporter [Gammaproteobacteria bacterium]|nr:MMPL family transporter [Gammaproteobacteria bacterium]MCY4220010.1 MMPL family transporter [Gammaproteobacteria bacterium]MCY4273814.1 MMPL family transporter [Gammaproteobacteria bacterium]
MVQARSFPMRFGKWVVYARIYIIAAVMIASIVAASGIISLTIVTDYRAFFEKGNPELQAFDLLEDTYEKSDNVLFMIVPDDRNATSEQALAAALWLTERSWQIPFGSRVDSISNFQTMSSDGDGLVVVDLVDPELIGDATRRQQILDTALEDPRLAGNLIAHDGAVSAVNVTIKLPDDNNAESIASVADHARRLTIEAKEAFPGIDFRVVGTVILNQTYTEATIATMSNVFPASLVIMILIIWFFTRGFASMVSVGTVVILSVAATMGIAGWIGIPFSSATSATPVIVLTLSVAHCLHILVTVQECIGVGDTRKDAVMRSIEVNLYPIFLASVTTAIGFLMINFSEVPLYRHLGTSVAIGSIISFLLSVSFLPGLLLLLPVKPRHSGESRFGIAAVSEMTIRHKTTFLWGSILVVVVLSAAIPQNELNDVITNFFDESVQLRKDIDFLDENLSGNTVIEYSIAANGPGEISDPVFLEDLDTFADWFRAQPETRHVLVLSDTFLKLNKSMHDEKPEAYRIPENRDLASQFLLLYELSLPFGLDLNNRIDIAKSATRMTVTARTLSTNELLELDARAKSWLKENTPSFSEVYSSGPALMFAHIGDRNIRAMLVGTAISFLCIALLLVSAFRSLRIGLMSLVANFVPGLMAFGLWGMMVGEIGLALSVVLAMTIGIVVDDSVHFLCKYLHARRHLHYDPEDSIRFAFQTVGRALFSTTVILTAGFLVLGLSSFQPTEQMGQLTAIVIALALICDFLFLPPLLLLIDRQPKQSSKIGKLQTGRDNDSWSS